MTESRAGKFLKQIKEEDALPAAPGNQEAPASPVDGAGQPAAANPDSPALQALDEEMANDPTMMAKAADHMAGMCERYMDTGDSTSWTPESPEATQAVQECKHMLGQAASMIHAASGKK